MLKFFDKAKSNGTPEKQLPIKSHFWILKSHDNGTIIKAATKQKFPYHKNYLLRASTILWFWHLFGFIVLSSCFMVSFSPDFAAPFPPHSFFRAVRHILRFPGEFSLSLWICPVAPVFFLSSLLFRFSTPDSFFDCLSGLALTPFAMASSRPNIAVVEPPCYVLFALVRGFIWVVSFI